MSNIIALPNNKNLNRKEQFKADVKRGLEYAKKLDRIEELKRLIAHNKERIAKLAEIRAPKIVVDGTKQILREREAELKKLQAWADKPADADFLRAMWRSIIYEVACKARANG